MGDKVMYNSYESCPWTNPPTWPHNMVSGMVMHSRLAQLTAIRAAYLLGLGKVRPDGKWWFDVEYIDDIIRPWGRGENYHLKDFGQRIVSRMERSSDTYNVRAVERAVQILSSFDGEHAERGVSEIAQVTGLHKSTAHRIIMTLLNCGFLERTVDEEKVRLGLRLVELGLGALRDLDFRRAAFPYMEQLVEPALSRPMCCEGNHGSPGHLVSTPMSYIQ
jgi:hypothetical protein